MDESTDVVELSILIVFVGFVFLQSYKRMWKSIQTNRPRHQIFNLLYKFVSSKEIPWKNSADIWNNSAIAITGHNNGVIARIKRQDKEL